MNDEETHFSVPNGFMKRFRDTPKMIFGTEPEGAVLRQITYIETYLERLAEYLMYKLKVDRDLAEDLTLKFMSKLFASPAIRENAWGKYRYFVCTCLLRFARKELKARLASEQRMLGFGKRLAMLSQELCESALDKLFDIERRQIYRAIEEGVIGDFLSRGIVADELTELDVTIWNLTLHRRMNRRAVVASDDVVRLGKHVTEDTVKNALVRVETYFARHASEVRLTLRDL